MPSPGSSPGDPCVAALGERANPESCAAYSEAHGLDKAIIPGVFRVDGKIEVRPAEIPATLIDNQFVIYLGKVIQGDFGESSKFGLPVTDLLLQRLPATVELALYALLFAIVVGIPLGIISAYRRNSAVDVGTMMFANLGVSTPVFVLGLVLAYVFAVTLKDTPFSLPPSGRLTAGMTVVPLAEAWGLEGFSGPIRLLVDFLSNIYTFNAIVTLNFTLLTDTVRHMILPALALGTIPLAIIARMTRSSLLDELGLDYIRTARAKGLRDRGVVMRHGFRNALLPVVTVIGLQLGAPVRRRGPDRDDLQPGRGRASGDRGDRIARLRSHPGLHARDRDRLRRRQPDRRHLVRLPRSAGPAGLNR